MKCLIYIFACLFLISHALSCPITPQQLTEKIWQAKTNKMINPLVLADENISEEEFNGIVNRIRDFYTPVFASLGKKLNVYSNWSFPLGNAFATEDANGSNVYFFGVFTKNKFMTKDAFLFVACHEIGHHLGGYPKSTIIPWGSTEGQSDYFAANKCYREMLKNDPINQSAEKLVLPQSIKDLCKEQYSDLDEYQICLRGARAAEDVGKVLDFMDNTTVKDYIYLLQPESAPVQETISGHPSAVCRTQTILQASLCNRPSDIAISDTDETVGVCHERNGDVIGNRAHCWFKPKDD